jgi:hypothetical protein
MRDRLSTALFVVCALAGFAHATAAQSVDEIVARHIEARGGEERLRAIQTIKITRKVANQFATFNVTIFKKRPQLFRAESTPAGGPTTTRGINPEGAWDTGQGGKIVMRAAEAAAETRDLDADFDGLLVDWKAKGHTVTFEGKEPLPGGDALRVKVVTKSGTTRVVYLDARTYLDRRHTGVLNLPGGRKFDVSIDFGNWRDVNGVKFPFDISEERTGKEPVQSLVSYTDKIEINVPMEDSLFATPKEKNQKPESRS